MKYGTQLCGDYFINHEISGSHFFFTTRMTHKKVSPVPGWCFLFSWPKNTTHIWVVVSNIFYFHPYLVTWSNLTNIFQMGWNHQLDMVSHDFEAIFRSIISMWDPIPWLLSSLQAYGDSWNVPYITGVVAGPLPNGRTSWLLNGGDPSYLLSGVTLQVNNYFWIPFLDQPGPHGAA